MAELSANTLRYVDYGLARHTRYWYRLTAHNSQGSSDPQAVQAETAAEPVSIGEDWVEGEIAQTVIDYQYDALYRLTQANYSDGTFFHYAYDSNGNRVSETTEAGTVESLYDAANRLTSVGATSYTWDANGNLTSDGGRTYSYNAANRLTGVTQNGHVVSYDYNGLGDRLVEGATQFEMDLNTGLTQALSDGANTYLYGNGRIRQFAGVDSAYFLGDALGSVRQLVDETGAVTLTRNYAPFGEVMDSTGKNQTKYSFTGDWTSSNLLYLRARFLETSIGRFINRDPSNLERNLYLYANSNPINYTDPSGFFSKEVIAQTFDPYGVPPSWDYVISIFNLSGLNHPSSIDVTALHKHWGLLASLLDAQPGDTIQLYSLEFAQGGFGPTFLERKDIKVGYDSKMGILANGESFIKYWSQIIRGKPGKGGGFTDRLWRDTAPRYYHLNAKNGFKYYVDGSMTTDYPDFRSIAINEGGVLASKLIQYVGCNIKGSFGPGLGISALVDRFGRVYGVITPSFGAGFSLAYSEGYVISDARDIVRGVPLLIKDKETLMNSISGLSGGMSLSFLYGASASLGGTSWDWLTGEGGVGSIVFSQGLQGGVSADYNITIATDLVKPEFGWNWAIEHQTGESSFIKPVFLEDILNR